MSDGWTTLGELPDGQLFETRDGVWWEKRRGLAGRFVIVPLCSCGDDCEVADEDTPARTVTPVHVAPGLDPTLKGLLLHALATGETAPLCDRLLELNADQDAAKAIRANLLREIIRPDGNGNYTMRLTAEMIVLAANSNAVVYSPPPDVIVRVNAAGDSDIVY